MQHDDPAPYLGPRVDPRRSRTVLTARIRSYVDRRTREIHEEAVATWATLDDAPFPDRSDARRRAEFEAETLFRALGRWAAVPEGTLPFAERPSPWNRGWWEELTD